MKTVLICLLLITKSFVGTIPYTYTPCDIVYIHQGTPLTDEQAPIIVPEMEHWISLSEKIVCPQPFLTFATNQFDKQLDSSDHHSGNHHPVSQLSGFVQ